jgi:hypothetical protein
MNAGFETLGAAFNILNIVQILKEKQVRGVSLVPTALFTAWGLFNIFFYSYNHLPVSAIAAIAMSWVNATWVFLAIKYKNNES